MKASLQVVMLVAGLGGLSPLGAQAPQKAFTWDAPKVTQSLFSKDLGMLDSERDEYATNLATLAANQIAAQKASPQSLADARKMIGLALHLSPRNKRAVILNFQLSKAMVPEAAQSQYSPQVFARLLMTRAQLLDKQGGGENKRLARYFFQLAADLDPRNDDAVYHAEVQRLDHGEMDWSVLSRNPKSQPATE